jgi:hypothetical protein
LIEQYDGNSKTRRINMRRNERLEGLFNAINSLAYDDELHPVKVFSSNFNAPDNKKKLEKFVGAKLAKFRDCYGLSCDTDGIVINSAVCSRESDLELGTLIHETVHQWHDYIDFEGKIHGKNFRDECYRIGRLLNWSDEEIEEYII